jgi:hypothetical protein
LKKTQRSSALAAKFIRRNQPFQNQQISKKKMPQKAAKINQDVHYYSSHQIASIKSKHTHAKEPKKKAPSELITATTRADVSDFQFKPGFGATIGHFRGSVFLRCYV